MLAGPTLVLNPRDDTAFAEAAHRLAVAVDEPADLASALRGLYPAVVVRPRTLSGEAGRVWYVYRDGSWVSGGR